MSNPVHVVQTGMTIGSWVMSGVFSAGFLSLVGVVWKTRVPMKSLGIKAEEQLRADLMKQLKEQDTDHAARVTRLETRLDEQKKLYESKLDYERVVHENEVRFMRHRMNNLDQCLTMLLALIETNPDKAQIAATRVREMREKQEQSESVEKATIAVAAALVVTQTGVPAAQAPPSAPIAPVAPTVAAKP